MRRATVAILASFALVLGMAPPAFATNEINFVECLFVGDYFAMGVRNSGGTGFRRCFANAGELWIDQSSVESISSGNNAGYFEYEPGDGWLYRHYFPKWHSITTGNITITKLVIY